MADLTPDQVLLCHEGRHEQRSADRSAIELRVEYQRLNSFFHDYTKNISQGGTFVRTKRPLAVGTRFVFSGCSCQRCRSRWS